MSDLCLEIEPQTSSTDSDVLKQLSDLPKTKVTPEILLLKAVYTKQKSQAAQLAKFNFLKMQLKNYLYSLPLYAPKQSLLWQLANFEPKARRPSKKNKSNSRYARGITPKAQRMEGLIFAA